MNQQQQVIQLAEDYVKKELANNDASHDYAHIERVVNMAKKLSQMEQVTDEQELQVITLAALLHDVHDYKYSGSESAGVIAITKFLEEIQYPALLMDQIVYIVDNLSFKNELTKKDKHVRSEWEKSLAIVQDADRLDAIGAIGIARCMAYSGAKNRPIHDPSVPPTLDISKEAYMDPNKKDTAINHFYEKLFKLKDLMKTESGKKVAQKRHDFMAQYVNQFLAEWNSNEEF
jgi:uncharacterized protein